MKKCKKCTKRPNYGKKGGSAEYCKQHAPEDYEDVTHKRCKYPDCKTLPSYGKKGGSAEYCKQHAPKDYEDVTHKRCKYPDCKTRPNYGEKGGSCEYCKQHAPKDYEDVHSKRCKYPDCKTQPSYGKKGGSAEYCKQHAPKDYENVVSKRCKYPDCKTQPSYGKKGGGSAEYCKQHAPEDYEDVANKRCKYPDCKTLPTYGKKGGGSREYCKQHAPKDYEDVVNKRCKYPDCKTLPSYGKKGGSREYCKQHAPKDYEDVHSKRCKYPDCKTQPSYGKKGGSAEYCKQHAPEDYEDVASKRCKYPDCKTRPSYNFIGFSVEFCGLHKKEGMIRNPIKYCVECKKKAVSVDSDRRFFCPDHISKECKEFENICSICCSVYLDNVDQKICSSCNEVQKSGKTIKTKNKELSVKNMLDSNGIVYDIYDRKVEGGCSRKRPDFLISTEWGNIILEVDENQHRSKNYNCHCEIFRMRQLYFDVGTEKLLVIRYNPDNYESSYGKVFSESKRSEYLLKTIRYYEERMPKYSCTILYLFYDGFSYIDEEVDGIDPYESSLVIYRNGGRFIIDQDERGNDWLIEI